MKRKLQFLSVVAMTAFIGAQTVNAQTGGSYNPAAPTVAGTAPTVPGTVIEIENFDLGNNANATANPGGVGPFSYSDTTVNNTYTPTGYGRTTDPDLGTNDVDVADGPNAGQLVIAATAGTEYLNYTINVTTSGNYHFRLKHAQTNAGAKFQLKLFTTDGVYTALLLGNQTLPGTGGFSSYQNYDSATFIAPINAGTYILQILLVGGGFNMDNFELVLDAALGVNDFEVNNTPKVYPNPSANGVFNLGEASKWEAYSALGVKVAQGEGTVVDLSATAKGVYLIKTAKTATKVIYQ